MHGSAPLYLFSTLHPQKEAQNCILFFITEEFDTTALSLCSKSPVCRGKKAINGKEVRLQRLPHKFISSRCQRPNPHQDVVAPLMKIPSRAISLLFRKKRGGIRGASAEKKPLHFHSGPLPPSSNYYSKLERIGLGVWERRLEACAVRHVET